MESSATCSTSILFSDHHHFRRHSKYPMKDHAFDGKLHRKFIIPAPAMQGRTPPRASALHARCRCR
eukprot:13701299-Heterocapsa_arctica.AAC.1